MRFSGSLIRTLREAPDDADTANHQLLLRAGLIQQLAAGIYSFLPLGWRAHRKITQVIREEMDGAGGVEVHLPALQPRDLWRESGRDDTMASVLFRTTDKREREFVLGPTHEEVIVDLVRRLVQSYRDLPVLPYQVQTKFRDEPRSRGGLVRVREFTMKDLYSFDADWEGLDRSYDAMVRAYARIFARCGVPAVAVLADSGAIGGRDSQEFMYLTDIGEDTCLLCPACRYTANAEKAELRKPPAPAEPLAPREEVYTPGVRTIEELVRFLGVPASRTLKAVFYVADGRALFVAIRGDLEVNEVKLRNALRATELRLMSDDEARRHGLVAGSASPIGVRGMTVVADDSAQGTNLVAGANRADRHLMNVNIGRDWRADILTDIALARAGDACPQCGTTLQQRRGIELGHVFKLGTVYAEKLRAGYLTADGRLQPCVMGCYGIGVDRLLAAVIEANHDEAGIVWPRSVAPFAVHLVGLNIERQDVRAAADTVYESCRAAGIEVLYDDRAESAGVKLNDADLLGMPLRVVVSPRAVASGEAELRARADGRTERLPLGEVAARTAAWLARKEYD